MANSPEMDRLTAEVAEDVTIIESAVTLIDGISQQLRDAIAANDPAALTALADALDASSQKLAAAVTANTPAATTT